MFTYKWIIENFEVSNQDNLQNIVTKINWKYIAYDENDEEVDCELDTLFLDSPSKNTFIEFENLTEELVISWIESKIIKEDLETSINLRYIQNTREPIQIETNTVSPPWS